MNGACIVGGNWCIGCCCRECICICTGLAISCSPCCVLWRWRLLMLLLLLLSLLLHELLCEQLRSANNILQRLRRRRNDFGDRDHVHRIPRLPVFFGMCHPIRQSKPRQLANFPTQQQLFGQISTEVKQARPMLTIRQTRPSATHRRCPVLLPSILRNAQSDHL